MANGLEGFKSAAQGGASAVLDLAKSIAPSMLQSTMQNDFRMKHLDAQLDFNREKIKADSEISLINNVWSTGNYRLIDQTFSKGEWETEAGSSAVTKLLPIAKAKVKVMDEFKTMGFDAKNPQWVRDNYYKAAGNPLLESQVKLFLDGNIKDKEILLGEWTRMYQEHPHIDRIKQLSREGKIDIAYKIFTLGLDQTQKSLEIINTILTEEFRDQDPTMYQVLSDRRNDLIKILGFSADSNTDSTALNSYAKEFGVPLSSFTSELKNHLWENKENFKELSADWNSPDDITNEFIKLFMDSQDPNQKLAVKELLFKSSVEDEDENGMLKGIFEKGKGMVKSALEPDPGDKYTKGIWENDSGEQFRVKKSNRKGGGFEIKTISRWQNRNRSEGTYPNFTSIDIDALAELGLTEK